MITPGDISDELIEKAEAECDYNVGAWDCADPKEIAAAILNAAIEAGVVSPPVYCTRDNQGNLLDYEVYGLWTSPDGAESQIRGDCTAEHWKGQTE